MTTPKFANDESLVFSKRGYTLIEVLLVIGILALTARGALFLSSGYLARRSLNNETNELASALRNAEVRAVSGENNQSWGIHFINNAVNPDEYLLFSGLAYTSSTAVSHVMLSSRLQFSDPTPGNSKDIIFSQLTGLPTATSSVSIQLLNNGVTKRVEVNSVGLVTVYY